jgi:hypothetical protein
MKKPAHWGVGHGCGLLAKLRYPVAACVIQPPPVEKMLIADCAIQLFADRRRPEHDVPGFGDPKPVVSRAVILQLLPWFVSMAGLQDELDTGREYGRCGSKAFLP